MGETEPCWVGMAYEELSGRGLDYAQYRLGGTRLCFRGPRPVFAGHAIAVIGGSETYGKFVARPYPALLQDRLGSSVLNLGCMHAGPGAFLSEPAALDLAARARVVVLQVVGAGNMSNRFYSVHPRRNDRFLRPSAKLRALCPQIDFAQFNFTRHLLAALATQAPDAFKAVCADLRAVWLGGMRMLIRRLSPRPVLLLWMSQRPPNEPSGVGHAADPLLIDRALLEELRADVFDIVEQVASADAQAEGLENRVYSQMEAPAALEVPGPRFHAEVAAALAERLGQPDLLPVLKASRSARARR